jgi:hypothetical protein
MFKLPWDFKNGTVNNDQNCYDSNLGDTTLINVQIYSHKYIWRRKTAQY